MVVRFVVAVRPDLVDQVAAMVAAHIEPCLDWWETRLEAAQAIERAADRRQALGELRRERDRRRRAGLHFDSPSAVLAPAVQAELDRRGWSTRKWPAVPHGEAALPGRRWGVENALLLHGRLRIYLPDDLAELVRRATWHTSAPATRRLQQIAAAGPLLPKPLRAERTELRSKVVTTGDVIRAAARHAVVEWAGQDQP
jgi:hypothetical protein